MPSPFRFGLVLLAIAMVAFFGFLVLGASAPSLLMQPVVGAVPLSFFLAAGLIVGAIALTGIYVLRANAIEDSR
jgi:putative solute:sodium symporter small subunit